jgi:hypothetical protein
MSAAKTSARLPAPLSTMLSVSQTFQSAVAAFNARRWDILKPLLDDDVIALHVTGKGRDVKGVDNVIAYLKKDVDAENPYFIVKTMSVNGSIVTGIACWTDPQPVEVTYVFKVKNDKITHMVAPEDGNPCS